jgi:hypothetical protein
MISNIFKGHWEDFEGENEVFFCEEWNNQKSMEEIKES